MCIYMYNQRKIIDLKIKYLLKKWIIKNRSVWTNPRHFKLNITVKHYNKSILKSLFINYKLHNCIHQK